MPALLTGAAFGVLPLAGIQPFVSRWRQRSTAYRHWRYPGGSVMKTLLGAALSTLLLMSSPTMAASPGDTGNISFACDNAKTMEDIGSLLEDGADDAIMSELANAEIESNECWYFPNGETFTFEELQDSKLQQHEVWEVTLQHGTGAYLLHKIP